MVRHWSPFGPLFIPLDSTSLLSLTTTCNSTNPICIYSINETVFITEGRTENYTIFYKVLLFLSSYGRVLHPTFWILALKNILYLLLALKYPSWANGAKLVQPETAVKSNWLPGDWVGFNHRPVIAVPALSAPLPLILILFPKIVHQHQQNKVIESIYCADRWGSPSWKAQQQSTPANTPINLAHSLRWKELHRKWGWRDSPVN